MDALLYVLAFAIIAAPEYFIDRRFGAPVYRVVWNVWHAVPLSGDVERGFIVGRKTRERILPSIALTLIWCFLLSYYIHDPIELIMKSPLIFVGHIIGFLLVGLAMREGKAKTHNTVVDFVCESLDKVESGDVDLLLVAEGALKTGTDRAKEAAANAGRQIAQKVTEAVVAPSKSSTAGQADQPAPPPASPVRPNRPLKDILGDYSKGR